MNITNTHKDFYKVENLNFDILKLQEGLKQILKIKNYETVGGISHFGAICLNQIPVFKTILRLVPSSSQGFSPIRAT